MKIIAEKILKEHKLRNTPIRIAVLSYFKESNSALSHANLEQYFNNQFDRVTLYRTINSFIENGILHKVLDDSGSAKYAVCNDDHCEVHQHNDNHVHFKCTICMKIECLHHAQIPKVKVPVGYTINAANLLLEGVCNNCSTL